MTIPKKSGKRTKTEPLKEPNSQKSEAKPESHHYVVPESVMENFVKHLRVRDAETAMARLQTVSDLTAGMLIDPQEIDRADVEIIKRLAAESRDKDYRQIIKQIVAAIEQGEEGVEAAHRTAARAVEVGFRWSIYYFGALEMYKNRLRKITWSADSGG
jgi:hypothetical protein